MQSKLLKDDFIQEIKRMLEQARKEGKEHIEIVSKDVHENLGGYPSPSHRMPVCCDAMYTLKKETDEVIYSPKNGKGATLRIKYYL